MRADELKQSIEKAIPGSQVQVQDVTGTGDHFQATVISAEFEGKSRVEQHQMVYGALSTEMAGDLHAVGLKTYTPDAWDRLQAGTRPV